MFWESQDLILYEGYNYYIVNDSNDMISEM